MTTIEKNTAVWIAEGDIDAKFRWPWLQSRQGLIHVVNAVVYCPRFGTSEEELIRYGELARRWATNPTIPFLVVSHEPPTVMAPDIAIVGVHANNEDEDYPWFTRDGDTLELSPGIATNRDAPAHIVLDTSHRIATRFTWDGIHRIGLDE